MRRRYILSLEGDDKLFPSVDEIRDALDEAFFPLKPGVIAEATKRMAILRGLPGSGKSTKAERLRNLVGPEGCYNAIIASADSYFIRPDGAYGFQASELEKAHQWSQLQAEQACRTGKHVIVDNTNMQLWEFDPYLELAQKYGYEVTVEQVGGLTDECLASYHARQTHGVSLDAMKRMRDRWQEYKG